VDVATQLAHSKEIAGKIAYVLQKRVQSATEQYGKRLHEASDGDARCVQSLYPFAAQLPPWNTWYYIADVAQRSVLFWDTLRERGTEFVERTSQGLKPVVHFD